MIAVNKADGENAPRAQAAQREYRAALHIMAPADPDWSAPVLLCSGLRNQGLDALWAEIERHREIMQASGKFDRRRQDQEARWLRAMLQDRILAGMLGAPAAKAALATTEADVRSGAITAPQGVDAVLEAIGLGAHFAEA